MKPAHLATWFLFVLGAACRPEVGPPISQISGPAILAVKGVPAEVDPRSANTTVAYEALAVDVAVPGPGPGADISSPLLWATCDKPKPPTENNSVSSSCLDENALPGAAGSSATTYSAPVPVDACSQFGPNPPQAQPPIRPRDADVTGGYYLPIRVELLVPEELRRVSMTFPDSLVAFQLERIYCGLADAPADIIREYTANYKLNNNPLLTALTVGQPSLDPVELPISSASVASVSVGRGQTIALWAYWSDDSAEPYPAYDVIQRILVYHPREAMRVSWYATGGSFEHDITGRGENESENYAENTWKSDVAGLVHMWLVLHDIRGGTDFAAFDFNVTP
jgi:hypothetical protein